MEFNHQALAMGSTLGEYRLDKILGVGGFGITYLATDTYLDKQVAIKEYLPGDWAVRDESSNIVVKTASLEKDFSWGKQTFIDEAKLLGKMKHPNIVEVFRYFEALGTAYIVMELIEGGSLLDKIENNAITPKLLMKLADAIADGLSYVHSQTFSSDDPSSILIHRDISPDNILFRKDGTPVLIDFGAARQVIGLKSKAVSAIVKDGYAPVEQYGRASKLMGPWTDIYAFAAVMYECVSGVRPHTSTDRLLDDSHTKLLKDIDTHQYNPALIQAIDAGMKVRPDERPRSVSEWQLTWQSPETPQPSPVIPELSELDTFIDGSVSDGKIGQLEMQALIKTALARGLMARDAHQYIVTYAMSRGWMVNLDDAPVPPAPKRKEKKPVTVKNLSEGQGASQKEEPTTQETADAAPSKVMMKAFFVLLLAGGLLGGAVYYQNSLPVEPPVPHFNLTVNVLPENANITVDGYRGEIGFGSVLSLPEGGHDIVINFPGLGTVYKNVELNQDRVVTFNWEAPEVELLSLTVNTDPSDARVRVMNIVETYSRGMELAAGQYQIEVSAPGFVSQTSWVTLAPGNEVFRFSLDPRISRPTDSLVSSLVTIPAGQYYMGCSEGDDTCYDDEKPRHLVNVPSFRMMEREVTRGEFRAFIEDTGYVTSARQDGSQGCYVMLPDYSDFDYVEGRDWESPGFDQTDDHPATCISEDDAQAYLTWINENSSVTFRLPSEAEWEYAARAGSTAPYAFGELSGGMCRYDNVADLTDFEEGATRSWSTPFECNDGYGFGTAPVKSFEANDFGLYDMHGNVGEWTYDCLNESYVDAPTDGSAWISGNCSSSIIRGGNWSNNPRNSRVTYRFWMSTSEPYSEIGMRLAADL